MITIENQLIKACAGSGKTYALIQRLLSLLKAGVAPGEIVAITFTKKAAAEIRERLFSQLQELAQEENWAKEVLQRLSQANSSHDVINIHTFHGWFALLLMNKMGSAQWLGMPEILENDQQIREEAWRQWNKEYAMSEAVQDLLTMVSPFSVKELITQTLVNNSNAWHLYDKQYQLHLETQKIIPLQEGLCDALKVFVEQLSLKNQTAQKLDDAIGKAFSMPTKTINQTERKLDDSIKGYLNNENIESLALAFFTKDGTLRKAIIKNAESDNTLPLLQTIVDTLQHLLEGQDTIETLAFNIRLQPLLEAYLSIFNQLKLEKNYITFDELEYQVLIQSEQNNNINDLLYRTHCQYRHILIDEFQDTSPIQWQILHNWLKSTIGSDSEPSIFIVGDTKQAIYGFRYGDARLMKTMRDFLNAHFKIECVEESISRRCAPIIIDLVNSVFANNSGLSDFTPHETAEGINDALPGRLEWHDYSNIDATPADLAKSEKIRNPLITPLPEKNENYKGWANAIAQKILSITNVWHIKDEGRERPLVYEDILVLFPQKTHLLLVTDALGKNNVPYHLLDSGQFASEHFVYKDIIALLSALLSPYDEMALAQVLRSPIFGFSDDILLCLRQNNPGELLWNQLKKSKIAACEKAQTELQRWHGWLIKGALPVHDFLSRVFSEGQFISRYQSAVTASRQSEVVSVLNGFLDFSLSYKGGCYPLVQSFLDEIESAAAKTSFTTNSQGVKLMTIHGAKGLEAPVVILADTSFGEKFRGNKSQSIDCLIDWPPDNSRPSLFMLKPKKHYKRAFTTWYKNRRAQALIEDANLSYVALTRAKQALIIFSQRHSDVAKDIADYFAESTVKGDDLAVISAGEGVPVKPPLPLPPINTGSFKKTSLGESVHQIISLVLLGLDKESIATLLNAFDKTSFKMAEQLINNEELQNLLKTSHRFLVEQEFIDEGKIMRIDLLIFQQKNIWIVDYKTGKMQEKYKDQLLRYTSVVQSVYPDYTVQARLLINGNLQAIKP